MAPVCMPLFEMMISKHQQAILLHVASSDTSVTELPTPSDHQSLMTFMAYLTDFSIFWPETTTCRHSAKLSPCSFVLVAILHHKSQCAILMVCMVKSDPSHHSLTYVLSCSECQTCGHNYSKSFMSLTTACHKLSFGRSFFFGSWLCLCTRQFRDMLLNLILVVFGNVCLKITVILFRFISNICLGQFFISAEHFAFLSFLYTFLLSFHSFSEFSVLSVTLCLYTELVEMLSQSSSYQWFWISMCHIK